MRLVLIIALLSLASCSNKPRKTTVPDKPGSGASATQANLEQSADRINSPSGPSTLQPVGTPSLVPAPVTPPTKRKPSKNTPASPTTNP